MSTASFTCPRTCPFAGSRWCRFRPVLDQLGPIKVDSHTAKVEVDYKDVEAFRMAVEAMGGLWLGHGVHSLGDTEQTGYGFRLPMANGLKEIDGKKYWYLPLVLCDDGQLAYDAFGGAWGNMADLPKLKQEYAVASIEHAAQQQGWQTERTADGIVVYHPESGILTYSGGTLETSGFTGSGCHTAVEQLGLDRLGLTRSGIMAKPEAAAIQCEVRIPAR